MWGWPFTHVTTQYGTCQDAVFLILLEVTQSATFIKAKQSHMVECRYRIDVLKVDLHTVFFLYNYHEIVAISIQAANFFSGVGMWLFHLN